MNKRLIGGGEKKQIGYNYSMQFRDRGKITRIHTNACYFRSTTTGISSFVPIPREVMKRAKYVVNVPIAVVMRTFEYEKEICWVLKDLVIL